MTKPIDSYPASKRQPQAVALRQRGTGISGSRTERHDVTGIDELDLVLEVRSDGVFKSQSGRAPLRVV